MAKTSTTRKRGRPLKLRPEQAEALVVLARENPRLSLDDLTSAFRQQSGITVSAKTAWRYLDQAGLHRRRREGPAGMTTPAPETPSPDPSRYGYHEAHRDVGDAERYPCGLTDSEWEQVRPLFDPTGRPGRPAKYPRRQMLDACVYVLRSGCSWRMLPKDFPPWTVVYRTFRRWQARGLFETMYDELRRLWRTREHRAPEPTAGILDSQSVKTSPQGGPRGYDAAKKINGRKRHLVTDTLGLLIAVLITAGSTQDRDAALPVLELAKKKVPGLEWLFVDGGYRGAPLAQIHERHQVQIEVVRRPTKPSGGWYEGQLPLFEPTASAFVVLPKRWIIERTNAWNERPRRMNRDHDRNLGVSAAWIWLTEGRMLLRRLSTTATNQAA